MDQKDWLLKIDEYIGGCVVVPPGLLGKGGMGQVFLARHNELDQLRAVKVAVIDRSRPGSVDRFVQEARLAARLHHPNVVTIFDAGPRGNLYYLVMQHIHGKNLAELLDAAQGPLAWHHAVGIVHLAALGLQAVHGKGLVHRDVKPSNIMLSTDNHVYLMDFGLVREEADLLATRTGTIEGTAPFMSPEQYEGKRVTHRSDVFSLGSTLYNLVTNQWPFPGTNLGEVRDRIMSGIPAAPVQELNREVPASVSDVLSKAMAADPGQRFQTAGEMAAALRDTLRGSIDIPKPRTDPPQPPRDPPPTPPRPSPNRPRRSPRRISPGGKLRRAAIALAGVAALGFLAWLVTIDRPPPPPPPPEDMVRIEPGYVQLGDDPAKLRTFLTSHPDCSKMSATEIDGVLKSLAQETRERKFVAGFYIDPYEVTNAEYAEFVAATGWPPPSLWHGTTPPIGREKNPVTDVRYEDAEAFARWKGKKLPSREQWMRAYRGDRDWLFPWGDDYDASRANVGDNKRFPYLSPVTETPQDVSVSHVFNMVGNATEYVRGVLQQEGRSWRLLKGAAYNRLGFRYGIASGRLIQEVDVAAENAGFRCVVEESP